MTPLLQVKKTWQSDKLSCVWQLMPTRTGNQHFPKKFFLKLSTQSSEPALTFLRDKPDFTPLKHAFNELVRKYAEHAVISNILLDHESRSLYLVLHNQRDAETPQFLVSLSLHNPRFAELLDFTKSESIVRMGAQGLFTKRKPVSLPELSQLTPCWQDYLAPLKVDAATEVATEMAELTDILTPAVSSLQREILQKLRRRLRTVNKSAAKQTQEAITQEDITALEQEAKLLQTYAHLVKPDDFELRLLPEQTGHNDVVTISLDPELGAGENLNNLYLRLKKIRRGITIHSEQRRKTQETLDQLNASIQSLQERSYSDSELQALALSFGLTRPERARGKQHTETKSAFKIYKSHGVRVLVGKGAHENDELTKQAKANDFWIHAVGHSGSHVIVEGSAFKNQELPPALFRDAAILALHYSKARQDMSGEVYYTRRHKIKKKKGMPPGLWNVEQAQSVFVRYSGEELKAVLDKLVS